MAGGTGGLHDMPTIPQAQLDEIEIEMQELLEANEELLAENKALKAEVLRLRERLKTD
jgi:regulator of replication initiation timing